MKSRRGAKTELVEHAIESIVGEFGIAELERACPGVSRDMIRLLLRDLKSAGRIECLGRGPGAKWRKRVTRLNNVKLAESTNRKTLKPFLRWAGSKRKQLPTLSRFWNTDFTRYVEPFMGSACLCFELKPKRALLGDINYDLVRTFLAVRDHPQAVANRLAKIPRSRGSYYSIRSQKLSEMDAADAAAKFIFLNRYCFNGLYRTNEAGQFNVPFAPAGTGQLATAADLRVVSKALKSCTIKHADFESLLARTREGDFVYLDPPYAVGNRRVFRQYGPSSFGLHDLHRLAESLASMDARNVKFVLSYADCAEATKYFQQWPRRKMFIQRNIAGFGGNRRRAGEVLISNCFPEGMPHN